MIAGRKTAMPIFLLACLVSFSLIAGCKDKGSTGFAPLMINSPAPSFDLVDTGGRAWRLPELRGKVILLNFWATWCPSCVVEMPSINNLNVMASGAENFQILTVLFQDSPDRGLEYFRKEGYGMPILLDKEGRAARMYGLTGVPETFIIDKKGILRKKYIGPAEFDTLEMVQFFNSLLDEPS